MLLNDVEVDSIHINPDTVAEILRDAHANSTLPHNWIVNTNDKLLELSVGAVRKCWISDQKRKGSGRNPVEDFPMLASIPVCFNFRSARILADAGVNGFALINTAMLFEVPVHKGKIPPHLKDSLRIDFAATTLDDITLLGTSNSSSDALVIRTALVGFVHKMFSGTYPLPPEVRQLIVKDSALEIKPIPGPQQQLVIRSFRLDGVTSLRKEKIEHPITPIIFSKREGPAWAAKTSAQPLRERLVKLIEYIKNKYKNDISISSMDVSAVEFHDGFIELNVANESRDKIKSSSNNPRIYSSVNLSTLTSENGYTTKNLGISVYSASDSYLESQIDKALIPSQNKFKTASISLSPSQSSRVEARFLHPELRRNGMILHGSIDRIGDGGPPTANFSFLRAPDSMSRFTFDAAQSWSPSTELIEVYWNFGDGNEILTQGDNIWLILSHTFPGNGEYTVRLRITDALGRVAERIENVVVGNLGFELSQPMLIGENRYRTNLRVLSGNTPISGITIKITTPLSITEIIANDRGDAVYDGYQVLLHHPLIDYPMQQIGTTASTTFEYWGKSVELYVSAIEGKVYYTIGQLLILCNQVISELRTVGNIKYELERKQMQALVEHVKESLLNGVFPYLDMKDSVSMVGLQENANVDTVSMNEPNNSLIYLRSWLENCLADCQRLRVAATDVISPTS